jgi:GNAT superfamily N-acetyltransferase
MIKLKAIAINRLIEVNTDTLRQINALLPQLSPDIKPLNLEKLLSIVQSKVNFIYVATDQESGDRIVGMILMVVIQQFAGTKCWIEDVVVAGSYRNHGIAKLLIETAITELPPEASSINLTSNPERSAAHKLYARLDFEARDTIVFRRHP